MFQRENSDQPVSFVTRLGLRIDLVKWRSLFFFSLVVSLVVGPEISANILKQSNSD